MSAFLGARMPRAKFSEPDWPDLFEEPEGWRELQQQARSERDPRKLEAIIAGMNRLLSEREKRAAASQVPDPTSRRGSVRNAGPQFVIFSSDRRPIRRA